jgi:uncharacterized protein YjbJ (UPF0337 family)
MKMNSNQVKGAVKDAAGSVQRKAGELTDSPKQQAKGAAKQVEGKLQKKVGDLQSGLDSASRDAKAESARK